MVSLSTSNDASQGHQNNPQHSSSESTTSVIYSGNDPSRQPGPPLGLLHDDKAGHHLTESKDITILRRLKHAILEGQHPYFKANIDLSNLQDLVLTSGSRSTIPPVTGHQINSSGTLNLSTAQQTPHSLPSVYTNSSRSAVVSTLDSRNEQGDGASHPRVGTGPQRNPTQAPTEDVNMDQAETTVDSKVAEGDVHAGLSRDLDPDKQRGPSHTLGRYTLHSPIESTPTKHSGHKRKISDTPTLLDSSDKKDEPEIEIKRESSPYQFLGSQSQPADPSSSSIASFVSSASTALTSEDGVKSDTGHNVDADASGYDPKYGDKTEFLRRQKVRTRMIESIEEKNRRSANRPEERSAQKSPVRPSENGDRQSGARNVSPVRGREHPSRTHTQSTSRTADANGQGVTSNNIRRTPPPGAANERPPSNFETSPRGRPPAPSFTRAISPPPGKYSRPPRDYSPPRDYRSQYLPYDDPRPSRPRPVVSSPPRGSPPREPPAPRTASHRQSLDNYPGSFRGNESRSFDSRPPPTSPVFADRPRAGSYNMENDNWAGPARGRPAPPPSRNSPPSRDSSRDRTPFGSTNLPPNPAVGYRPRGLPDPAGSRYDPYDLASGRESSWPPSRDWTASSRLPDSKPKLQDRLTADSTWSREMTGSRPRDDFAPRPLRDDFAPRPNDDYTSRYRREPSPLRYSDGLRAGFSRPSEIEGIRPMKRSRPDDGYPPRGGPGPDRARYDMDAPPLGGDYYREAPRRIDDEYEPRARPPYGGWAP